MNVTEDLNQLQGGFDQFFAIPKAMLVPKLMPSLHQGPMNGGPTKRRAPPGPATPSAASGSRSEAILLRLSQHLLGRRSPGPGVDLFKLFARNLEVVTLEEAPAEVLKIEFD